MSEKLTIKYFLKMNLQKNHFEPQKMQLVMTSLLQRQGGLYFQKRMLAFAWISKRQFQMVSMEKCFRALVFSGVTWHLVTCDAGVADADYRGRAEMLLMNHHPHEVYTVRTGDRIGQIVFRKKYDVIFEKVSDPALLGRTKRVLVDLV